MKRHKRIDLIIVVALSVLIILFKNSEKGPKTELYLNSISLPFQSYTSFFFNIFKIKEENKILKEKVAELTLSNQILNTYKFENERLNALLDFKSRGEQTLIPAAIIDKPSNLFAETFSINKGQLAGVEKNLPVITQDGIYGKTIEVTPYSATVQTLFNFNFRVGGVNQRNGINGLVRWDTKRGCIFEQVPLHADINVGDQIVTSGIGSVFPKGIAIGKVKDISLDETKLYYSITLIPAADFSRASDVFVLKNAPYLIAQGDSIILQSSAWEIYRTQQQAGRDTIAPVPEYKRVSKFPVKIEIPEPTIRTD